MTHRRGFMKTLVGAFVASAIEIRLATAPVLPAAADYCWATSVLTNRILDEIYAKLVKASQEALYNRMRTHLSES